MARAARVSDIPLCTTDRLMTLLEEEDDDKPRDVAKNGITLRNLYQLRKDADAWHHVFKMKVCMVSTYNTC